jgi:hypothetical protein
MQRTDDANVVNASAELRQQLAHGQAAFAARLESVRHRHQAAGLVLGAKLHLRRALAGVLVQGGLRIERVGLERPTVHEKLNDTLGPRRKMRLRQGPD